MWRTYAVQQQHSSLACECDALTPTRFEHARTTDSHTLPCGLENTNRFRSCGYEVQLVCVCTSSNASACECELRNWQRVALQLTNITSNRKETPHVEDRTSEVHRFALSGQPSNLGVSESDDVSIKLKTRITERTWVDYPTPTSSCALYFTPRRKYEDYVRAEQICTVGESKVPSSAASGSSRTVRRRWGAAHKPQK